MLNSVMKFITKGAEVQTPFIESTGNEPLIMMGVYAKSALENPAFDAAFKRIEHDLAGLWKKSGPRDSEAREHLFYEIQALARVKGKLTGIFNMMIADEAIKKKNAPSESSAKKGD